MKMKYIKLFESEYWDKILRLRELGLAGEWAEKILDWIEKKRLNPDSELDALDLTGSTIKELPEEVSDVNSFIILQGSQIERLPARMRIGGSIWLQDCPNLRELPEDLEVGGQLVISRCPLVERLPKRLIVGTDLTIMDAPIRSLPEETSIRGKVSLIDTWISREEFDRWTKSGLVGLLDKFLMGSSGPKEGPRL